MINKYLSKKLIAFDVDGTLSPSRLPIDEEMAKLIQRLLKVKKMSIITGGTFERIKEQILNPLIAVSQKYNLDLRLENLILLPTNGGGLFIYDQSWKELSSHKLKINEKDKIILAIEKIDREDSELNNNSPFGEEIQDRGSEITYSALGDKAPLDLKQAWDPDFHKRISIQSKLKELLPEFEVKIGGTTSIDITPKGMDKAYAIKQLLSHFKLEKKDVLFLGDAIYPNGNDFPVSQMGVDTVKVSGPEETKVVVGNILK